MMIERYSKGKNAAMDAAFGDARKFGKLRLGGEHLFFRKGLFWQSLPCAEIVRAYRRVEQVKSSTSCCENDFDIHRLILEMQDGTSHTLLIGDGLFRHEPEQLMDALKAAWSAIDFTVPRAGKR